MEDKGARGSDSYEIRTKIVLLTSGIFHAFPSEVMCNMHKGAKMCISGSLLHGYLLLLGTINIRFAKKVLWPWTYRHQDVSTTRSYLHLNRPIKWVSHEGCKRVTQKLLQLDVFALALCAVATLWFKVPCMVGDPQFY